MLPARLVFSPPWRILAIAGLSLTGMLMEFAIARAGVKVQLEWDWVGIKPEGAKIGHHVSETYWIGGHNTFKYYDYLHAEHEVPLGGEGTTVNDAGDQGAVQVKIVGGKIHLYRIYPGRALLIEIASNGSNACRASITFYKLQGQQFAEARIQLGKHRASTHLYADERAENLSCSITQTSD